MDPRSFRPKRTASATLTLEDVVEEQRCRCIRSLWREPFGCRWPEVSMVKGAAE